jgi:hypothetical protein
LNFPYFAHQRGIVHRDIKPDNILLGPNHEIWVGDFGIATPSHTKQETPKTQLVIGTYPYMAPEHWEGHASSASDQYSLGIMVYEWLCGSRPFAGNATALYQQHKSAPPPPLREKLSTISPAVEQVVLLALAKKPQDRFDNIITFATASERAALGGGVPPTKRTPIPAIPTTPFASKPAGKHINALPKPPLDPIEQLFQEGVNARSSGNTEKEFSIWRQIMMTPNVPEKYSTPAHRCILEMRTQMIPLCLKQARVASMQGRWQDEIRKWEDLLALAPSDQDLAPLLKRRPLTLGTYSNSSQSIQQRLQIAKHNERFVWMYEGVQRSIHNKEIEAACTQLQMLWKDAPYYGDPAGFAQKIGLSATINYEQAIAYEQVLKDKQKQDEQALIDKQKQQERNNRILTIIIGTVILLGVVGAGVRAGAVAIVIGAVQLTLTGSMIVGAVAGMFAILAEAIKNEDKVLIIGAWVVVLVAGGGGGIVAGLGRVDGLEGKIAYGIMEGLACIIATIVVYWATIAIYRIAYGIARVIGVLVALMGKIREKS